MKLEDIPAIEATTLRAPRLKVARDFINAVHAVGGTVPQSLSNLIAAAETLKAAPPAASDPAAAILAAAVSGELTEAKLGELVGIAAAEQAVVDYRAKVRDRAEPMLACRFADELADGAADDILDSLRERFDAAAEVITIGATSIDLDQDLESFLDSALPEQLVAYQSLKPATDTVAEIIDFAGRYFGCRFTGEGYSVLRRPTSRYAGWVFNEDVFTTAPESALNARIDDSGFRPSGLRFSPWLRANLRLNTIAEAQQLLDDWDAAQAATFAAMVTDAMST